MIFGKAQQSFPFSTVAKSLKTTPYSGTTTKRLNKRQNSTAIFAMLLSLILTNIWSVAFVCVLNQQLQTKQESGRDRERERDRKRLQCPQFIDL